MSSKSLNELLIEEIRDLYHAENQLVKALPKMSQAADNVELRAAFNDHLTETQEQVARLERVFRLLNVPVKGKTCPAMEGLVKEANEGISHHDAGPVRDALLIGAAQRIEHYEIAAYGTARAFAEKLGEDQVATLLQQTLDEEGAADKKLTGVSATVNSNALAAV